MVASFMLDCREMHLYSGEWRDVTWYFGTSSPFVTPQNPKTTVRSEVAEQFLRNVLESSIKPRIRSATKWLKMCLQFQNGDGFKFKKIVDSVFFLRENATPLCSAGNCI